MALHRFSRIHLNERNPSTCACFVSAKVSHNRLWFSSVYRRSVRARDTSRDGDKSADRKVSRFYVATLNDRDGRNDFHDVLHRRVSYISTRQLPSTVRNKYSFLVHACSQALCRTSIARKSNHLQEQRFNNILLNIGYQYGQGRIVTVVWR